MFERYYRELLNFLTGKVRDRDVASDLTQESFARVYASARSGNEVRNPRALLYSTAKHLLIDQYRQGQHQHTYAASAEQDSAIEPDTHAGPSMLEPEEAAYARERFVSIAQVIDALPPRCREAFLLVKYDGLSHAETAKRMGISVKTVEMQIQIALRACWRQMDALESEAAEILATAQQTTEPAK